MGAGHAGPMTQGILEPRKDAHGLGFTALHSSDNEGWPRSFTCRHAGCGTRPIESLPPSNPRVTGSTHWKPGLTSGSKEKYAGECK